MNGVASNSMELGQDAANREDDGRVICSFASRAECRPDLHAARHTPLDHQPMPSPLPPFRRPRGTGGSRIREVRLRAALDETIPRNRPLNRSLLTSTWNLKKFGLLTEKWIAGQATSPKLYFRGLWARAEIVSRFDVVALPKMCVERSCDLRRRFSCGSQCEFPGFTDG
jgi:hypothetical protein